MAKYKKTKADKEDEAVAKMLEVISDYTDSRVEHDRVIDAIQELLNETWTIQDPTGTMKLSGQLMFQALWRTASRMKPLDFMAHGSFADERVEKIVRDGINTVMDRGQYISSLRGKNGAFYELLLYGDALIQVGANEKKGFPIRFSNCTLKNVYVNTTATGIRVPQAGRSARQLVIVYTYTRGEFDKTWPEFKDKVENGRIQRAINGKDQLLDDFQAYREEDEQVEVAYSYDLDTECFLVVAGGNNTVLEKKMGDAYPFIIDDEAYIPVLQFVCIPSNEGFWNIGIGHLIYKLTILTRQLMNMEVNHIFNNVLPIDLISVAQGKSSQFFQGLKQARKMQAQGHRAFVPMERSDADPNNAAVSSQTLLSQNLFNEWAAIFDRLVNELRRLGINVDELDAVGTKTATEIIALEENSNSLVKQIGEWNSDEYKFAVDLTMDFIKEFVPNKDKTPLDLTTKIEMPSGMKDVGKVMEVTLGMISEELKKNRWFTRVDARSGNILSNTMLHARWQAALPFLQGTPLQEKAVTGVLEFLDLDIGQKQEQPQAQAEPGQPQPGGPQPGEPGMTQPAGTDRLEINPNVQQRAPAIR